MKAIIFAAGKGERILPLTATVPNPLLPTEEVSLLGQTLRKIEQAGCDEAIINSGLLPESVIDLASTMSFDSLECAITQENEPLETGNGFNYARTLMDEDPVLLVNGDINSEFDFTHFLNNYQPKNKLAHLVFVPNTSDNPRGDFRLSKEGYVSLLNDNKFGDSFTLSGICMIDPYLIDRYVHTTSFLPLRNLLIFAIYHGLVSGEVYDGAWEDMGLPQRLMKSIK